MPITPSKHDTTSPHFPHGSERGYKRGCRASYPCPATPTCATAHAKECLERRERRRAQGVDRVPDPGEARLGYNVRRRLLLTLTAVTLDELATRTGLTIDQITAVRDGDDTWVPEHVAGTLDGAWAWFRYGHDLDALTPEQHGHYPTYLYGCRCHRCCRARATLRKKQELGIKTPGSVEPVTAELAAHTRALVAAAGSRYALERVVGLEPGVLLRVTEQRGGVTRATIEKLCIQTPESVTTALNDTSMVDATVTRKQVGMLGAQGYPQAWVLKQATGADKARIHRAATKVTVRTARAVSEVFDRLADTPATPEATGLTTTHITKAIRQARARGYYPAMCYDEDGNLNVRALPGHPWSDADERAAATLDALYARARCEASISVIARRIGAEPKSVERRLSQLGLRSSRPGEIDLRADSVAIADRIKSLYWQYDQGAIGPVTALLTLGLTRTLPIQGKAAIPRNHPEWRAFFAVAEQGGEAA
jgi:hypothetical protein